MNILIFIFTVIGGMCVAVQASVNGALGKKTGILEASFISFTIGTIALALLFIFFGKGNPLQAFSVPKWQLTGGLLGALYITSIVLSVPKIGAASALFAAILGQIVISMIIDHFGFFGAPRIPFDWTRLTGVVLMAMGVYFVFQSSISS